MVSPFSRVQKNITTNNSVSGIKTKIPYLNARRVDDGHHSKVIDELKKKRESSHKRKSK